MADKLKVLDLFSGGGGFTLGLDATGGFETVAFCEIEPFPQKVLAKNWPEVPIYDDVRKLTKENGPKYVDLICGGYPCQPFSTAGQRKGEEDDRHLWPEVSRLLDEYRPTWFIGENVAGHISMGLDDVLSDLESKGYTARPYVIPACAVGAPHRRDRVWIVANSSSSRARVEAYSDSGQERKPSESSEPAVLPSRNRSISTKRPFAGCENVAHSKCGSIEAQLPRGLLKVLPEEGERRTPNGPGSLNRDVGGKWPVEPRVGRVADGVPNRAHRLKLLGNAVVPQIPEMIGYAILQAEADNAA